MQITSAPAQPPMLAGWRAIVFAPAGGGQRRRRGTDGVRLAGARHLANLDRPAAFNAAVRRFVRSLEPEGESASSRSSAADSPS